MEYKREGHFHVKATSNDGGSIKSQSVEANLLLSILEKMGNLKLLNTSLEFLAHKIGCPADEKFMMQHKLCEKCSEDQELHACWRNYLCWYKENSD